ncbi:MAG: hypothetical protein ACT4NX_09430 [Deltaproteobacteria bacterium]
MTKNELTAEFEAVVNEFIKSHIAELAQMVSWAKMPESDMIFGNADLSSLDFVLALLRAFKKNGARVIDAGAWQPFPNFAFPVNFPLDKLHPEETIDWNSELGL